MNRPHMILTTAITAALAALIAVLATLAIDDGDSPVAVDSPGAAQAVSTTQPVAAAGEERVGGDVIEPEGGLPKVAAVFEPAALFAMIDPSVVVITTPNGDGSGFFIDVEGHVVTNYHVVEGSTSVTVLDADGDSAEGTVLGFDIANDLAVVKVDPSEIDVRPVILGNSDLLRVGDRVAAIGTPFGLQNTVTTGIVSAVERTRPGVQIGGRPQRGMIQTDAPINPGNSGGVLINGAGEVIGVTSSVESPIRGSVGVGFAIPSDIVQRFLPQMVAGEEIVHPWMGIQGSVLRNGEPGLPVEGVVDGGPADHARILAGDRLLQANDVVLDDFEQLAQYLDEREIGEIMTFVVQRGGQTLSIEVELEVWPG